MCGLCVDRSSSGTESWRAAVYADDRPCKLNLVGVHFKTIRRHPWIYFLDACRHTGMSMKSMAKLWKDDKAASRPRMHRDPVTERMLVMLHLLCFMLEQ